MPTFSDRFPSYEQFDPRVPIVCATPRTDRVIHRFFDTSPFSPSGRYLGLTRLPSETDVPQPGDPAEVVVVDLAEGTEAVVATTRGWDTQLGAQVQWGSSDSELYYNDLDPADWVPHAIRLDPRTGARTQLEGTVYVVSPDGSELAGPCLRRTGATQAGYGVVVPPAHVPPSRGAEPRDGLFVTATRTGEQRLLLSFAQILEQTSLDPALGETGTFYGFHVKYNPQGTRLMFVVRWLPDDGGKRLAWVVTCDRDGSHPRVAIEAAVWAKGGHHPNWCPDGDRVMINLAGFGEGLRFVAANFDGTDLAPLHPDAIGSGHPTLHPDGRHILTDAYVHERVSFGDGTTPLRWVDLKTGEETLLARIRTKPDCEGPRHELRVDPHPAWDPTFRWFAFNAVVDGTRRVYVADMGGLL